MVGRDDQKSTSLATRWRPRGGIAGIIKPVCGSVGEAEGSVAEVFRRKAATEQAPLTGDQSAPCPPQRMAGMHQNATPRTALAALKALRERGWSIHVLSNRPRLCDVVNNTVCVAAGRCWTGIRSPLGLAHNGWPGTVKSMLAPPPRIATQHCTGLVIEKNWAACCRTNRRATYYFCKADIPAGWMRDAARTSCRPGCTGPLS
jgi:hypothetical protein